MRIKEAADDSLAMIATIVFTVAMVLWVRSNLKTAFSQISPTKSEVGLSESSEDLRLEIIRAIRHGSRYHFLIILNTHHLSDFPPPRRGSVVLANRKYFPPPMRTFGVKSETGPRKAVPSPPSRCQHTRENYRQDCDLPHISS